MGEASRQGRKPGGKKLASHQAKPDVNTQHVNSVNTLLRFEKLKCLYTNADQLKNKMNELHTRISDTDPHIIGITEVKPKNKLCQVGAAEYSLDEVGDYTQFTSIDPDKGRGMIMYVRNDLSAKPIKLQTPFEENLFVEVKLNANENLTVGLIYRSPSNNDDTHQQQLREIILEASSFKTNHMLLMGDFNYPHINWEDLCIHGGKKQQNEELFIDCLQDNFLFQHIKEPTRSRGTDKSNILDLVITKDENTIADMELQSPLGKGDHSVIIFSYICQITSNSCSKRKKCYNKGDFISMNKAIEAIQWENIISDEEDINKIWNVITQKIKELEDKYVPTKTIKTGKKRTFPVDETTLKKIKEKHALSRKATTSKRNEDRMKYNKVRNKVKKLCKNLRINYEKNIAKNAKTNPKMIWQYIKSKSNTRQGIGELYRDSIPMQEARTTEDEVKKTTKSTQDR